MKSLVLLRRIEGQSMSPTLLPGDVVMSTSLIKPRVGSVVIAKVNDREVIKRVESIENDQIRLLGDNFYHSQDSRHFGLIDKSKLKGVVIGYPRTFNALERSIKQTA